MMCPQACNSLFSIFFLPLGKKKNLAKKKIAAFEDANLPLEKRLRNTPGEQMKPHP